MKNRGGVCGLLPGEPPGKTNPSEIDGVRANVLQFDEFSLFRLSLGMIVDFRNDEIVSRGSFHRACVGDLDRVTPR